MKHWKWFIFWLDWKFGAMKNMIVIYFENKKETNKRYLKKKKQVTPKIDQKILRNHSG